MILHRSRSSVLPRWIIILVLLFGALFSYGQVTLGSSKQPDTRMPSVTDMTWPEGVALLAAQIFTLDEDDYQWRISVLTAEDGPGRPSETGRGVVVAITGTLLLQVNDEDFVRLEAGAAATLHEDDEIRATSAEGDPVEYLVIELLPFAQDNTTDESNLVGPIEAAEGDYALVLLNVPADATTDMAAEQVIDGALRPGVSISHTEDGIPERLDPDENYSQWIVALYPLGDTPVLTSAATATAPKRTPPPAAPVAPAAPTAAPTTVSAVPTAAPTSVPTAPPTIVPTVSPTSPPPTQPALPTQAPVPTEPVNPPATEPPMPLPTEDVPAAETPVPPMIPTPVPPVVPTIPPIAGD